MTERDKQTDRAICRQLEQLEVPTPDAGARRRAINAAMAEFEAVRAEDEIGGKKRFQGFRAWLRPIDRNATDNGRTIMPLKPRFIVTSMTVALAGIIAIGVNLHQPAPVPLPASAERKAGEMAVADQAEQRAEPGGQLVAEVQVATAPVAEQRTDRGGLAKTSSPPAAAYAKVKRHANALADSGNGGRRVSMVMPSRELPAAAALAGPSMGDADSLVPSHYQEEGRDSFTEFEQNPVRLVSEQPVSTFSVDVDTASYSFVRHQLNQGILPQGDAVRIEEMINYFDYAYPLPESREQPFKPTVIVTDSPWAEGRKLLHIGIKGFDLQSEEKPRSNLVFLLDVSGSMNSPDKLPLVKQSMELLLSTLDPDDTVAIAVYAGAAGTVMEPTPVKEKQKIIAAMNRLAASGATAGAQGIRLAYELAEAQFDKAAINRVIVATDGDFNVGISNRRELQSFIERKREQGIYLSVLGFGQGNYQDALMQTLAQNGNGVAAYIDTLSEAQKVLVHESTSTLFPIARDVKIQLEFNPATVAEYRLIGYETRHLEREDFNNDAVDAGDIGAGHTVTAIYEITPVHAELTYIEPSRYVAQPPAEQGRDRRDDEYGFLKIRYKLPGQTNSRLITQPIDATVDEAQQQSRPLLREADFATAVAGFGQLLKGGKYSGGFSYDDVIDLAQQSKGGDEYGYRTEFIQLVRKAKTASDMR